jgi:methionyl-tRNA formyltransferase
VSATPIAQVAGELGLKVIKPPRINAPEALEPVLAAGPDANVVVAFGQKIGEKIIASPRHGRVATMNLHASLLPRYRGAAPIQWAVIRGEAVTGNTVFALVDRMDAGDVLASQSTPIDPAETAGELHDRLAAMGPEIVLEVLDRLEAGTLQPHPQDDSQATVAPKLARQDAVIDFTATAQQVRCLVHGLAPWPGVHVTCSTPRGVHDLKLGRVEEAEGQGVPGTLVDQGVIATGRGAIRLLEVQPPGKRMMTWADFNHGARLPVGTVFRSSV